MSNETQGLREDVAKHYKLVGNNQAGEIRFMRRIIDLSKISLAEAHALAKAGCTILEGTSEEGKKNVADARAAKTAAIAEGVAARQEELAAGKKPEEASPILKPEPPAAVASMGASEIPEKGKK